MHSLRLQSEFELKTYLKIEEESTMKQILSCIQNVFVFSVFSIFISVQVQAKLTISGISSGAFMATQMGTIYSSEFSGVGSVAGGFFYCAQNHMQEKIKEGQKYPFLGQKNLFLFEPSSDFFLDAIMGKIFTSLHPNHKWVIPSAKNPIYQAVSICLRNPILANSPDLTEFAKKGLIDNPDQIKNQKIYIYQGDHDQVVQPRMAQRLEEFYIEHQVASSQIKVKTLPGGHNFPTAKPGLNECQNQAIPYVSSCKFNLAEDMLQHILGQKLFSRKANLANLYRIDQNLEPVNENLKPEDWKSPANSLGAYGYLYASKKCLDSPASCQLHVALHGCEMSDSFDPDLDERYSEQVSRTQILSMLSSKEQDLSLLKNRPLNDERKLNYGTLKFATLSGYIELAERNDLMILFPQTWIRTENYPYNPKGCWDWFGANNSQYATNKGIETSWLMAYVRNVSIEPKKYIMSTKPSFDEIRKK